MRWDMPEEELGESLLRKNHVVLLQMVKEEAEQRQQVEDRIQSMELDFHERVTSLGVERDTLRAEAVELRARLRGAQSDSRAAGLFERYEADIARLSAETASLRNRNLSLEMRVLSLVDAGCRGQPGVA
ncbi:unnamed protein product, partial [Discosporangium mesarthrocarpum]